MATWEWFRPVGRCGAAEVLWRHDVAAAATSAVLLCVSEQSLCGPVYAQTMGRPSIPPGVYFRCLFVGYFESIHSERGIAWAAATWGGFPYWVESRGGSRSRREAAAGPPEADSNDGPRPTWDAVRLAEYAVGERSGGLCGPSRPRLGWLSRADLRARRDFMHALLGKFNISFYNSMP